MRGYNIFMKSLTNYFKGTFGEKFVFEYLTKKGYKVFPSPNNGSDLIAKKGKKTFSIEIKTSGNLKGGIPDMHSTEFIKKNGKWFFVAGYLYIVRIDKKNKPIQIDILNKKEIDRYANTHKTIIRIRTTKLDKDLFKKIVGKTVKV